MEYTFNPWPDREIKAIYGPHIRSFKHGPDRRQVAIKFMDGRSTTMSYARWLMTQHLGRRLRLDEHVDHINEDALDDRIDNYQILTPSQNARKATLGRPSPFKGAEKGFRHGTMYGWMKKRCQCETCSMAKRSWHDARNERRRLKEGEGARGPYRPRK